MGGSNFVPSVVTVRILSLTILFSNLNALLITPILTVMNQEKTVLKIFIFAVIFNIVTNMILIPIMDFNGSAIVTVLTEAIICILSVLSVRNVFIIKKLFKNIFQYLVACFIIVLCKIIISEFILSSGIVFIVTVFVSIILYFGILILFKNDLVVQAINEIKNRRSRKEMR